MSPESSLVAEAALVVAEKQCTVCGETKPLSQFHRQRSATDGRRSECAVCATARVKAYQEAKRAEIGEESWKALKAAHVRAHRAKTGNERGKELNRAQYAALARLRENHRSEYDRLLALEYYERGL